LRPGEKMYEELLMDEEDTLPTRLKGIMISAGKETHFSNVGERLADLELAARDGDAAVLEVLKHAVPTYTYTPNSE